MINFLVAGEESQAICLQMLAMGINAYSCDIKPCSGGRPDRHLQMDMFEAAKLMHWHGAVFHPVCKFMCVSGLFRNIGNPIRAAETEGSLQQVCDILNLPIDELGLENPVSCISTRIYVDVDGIYKVIPLAEKDSWHIKPFKPKQTVQPYEFNENASKRTCFWVKGTLPKLKKGIRFPGRMVNGVERWANQTDSGQNRLPPSENRDTMRSKTYPGIAKAIAEQWGGYLINKYS